MQMKQLQMNKKEIGKEIEVLIRSIKLHYDNIAEEVRIPSIELELITAKIRKLHEKSIVFNHLHYMEEHKQIDIDINDGDDETPEENFIINAAEIPTPLVTPHIQEKLDNNVENIFKDDVKPTESEVQKPDLYEPIVFSNSEPIVTETPVTAVVNQPANTQQTNEMVGKDLKKIIGFSDKYFFISQLFGGNTDEFNIEINNLNFCADLNIAKSYLDSLQTKKAWVSDNEALQSLSRYINNKYN